MSEITSTPVHGKTMTMAGSMRKARRIGPYDLGSRFKSPVNSLATYLAKKTGSSSSYFNIKVLTKTGNPAVDEHGKMLLHNEWTLLNSLKGEAGVVQSQGLFKDEAGEDGDRIYHVLDLYEQHDLGRVDPHLENFQNYIYKEKRLMEKEAIEFMIKITQIVKRLHDRNIVHRDLKMSNLVLDGMTREFRLVNFGLAKQLKSEEELLKDKSGSPAYFAPEILMDKPYLGKPTDIWALGVLFYTMIHGQFPFFDTCAKELYKKIKTTEYYFPIIEDRISEESLELIRSIFVLEPDERITIDELMTTLLDIAEQLAERNDDSQIVPESIPPTSEGSEGLARGVKRKREADTALETALASNHVEETKEEVGEDHEPPKKVAATPFRINNRIKMSRIRSEARVLSVGDLAKLHLIYLRNKASRQAAAASQGQEGQSTSTQVNPTVGQTVLSTGN